MTVSAPIHAAVFDLDGLLVNTEELYQHVGSEILRRRGVISSAHVRAPGAMMDADDHKELDGLVVRLERRLAERGIATKAAE